MRNDEMNFSRSVISPPLVWAVALTLVLLFGGGFPSGKIFADSESYLAPHTILEFVATAVSVMVFALAFSLRHQARNSHMIIIGTGFLAVGLIDIAHTLSYPGMPDLLTDSSTEKAIFFWLSARGIAALILLAIAFTPIRNWSLLTSTMLTLAAIFLAAFVWWLGIYHLDAFPRTFIPGQGLTAFKIGTEYLFTLAYAGTAIVLFVKGHRSEDSNQKWLAAAA